MLKSWWMDCILIILFHNKSTIFQILLGMTAEYWRHNVEIEKRFLNNKIFLNEYINNKISLKKMAHIFRCNGYNYPVIDRYKWDISSTSMYVFVRFIKYIEYVLIRVNFSFILDLIYAWRFVEDSPVRY